VNEPNEKVANGSDRSRNEIGEHDEIHEDLTKFHHGAKLQKCKDDSQKLFVKSRGENDCWGAEIVAELDTRTNRDSLNLKLLNEEDDCGSVRADRSNELQPQILH
jgi:hypothetical protein